MSDAVPGNAPASVVIDRTSDRELVVTRTFNAPRALVFKAWTDAELFLRWWIPKSAPVTLVASQLDIRTGGSYSLTFSHPAAPEPFTAFGRYLEVVAPTRLVWTNEEGGDAGQVTTVTFEEIAGGTRVVMHDRYPTKEALDEALASGSTNWNEETFGQLDAVLAAEAMR